jgi:hypothetical protein
MPTSAIDLANIGFSLNFSIVKRIILKGRQTRLITINTLFESKGIVRKGDGILDCRIELRDGSILNIGSVDDSWYWIDLFEVLFERGDISEDELNFIESEIDMDSYVQSDISFVKQANLESPNLAGDTMVRPATKSLRRKEKNETSGGLRRRTSSEKQSQQDEQLIPNPTSGGLKRRKKQNIPTTPSPVPKIPPSSNLKKKIKSNKPKVVTSHSNSMPVKCSKNGDDWTAVLVSEHQPMKTKIKLIEPKGKFSLNIHLVLDDSGSMGFDNAEPNRQLIAAAQSFLSERPPKEIIILHTIYNSLSGKGSPSEISKKVGRLGFPGGTPMCSCLMRVEKQVSNGDVLIFFSDGGSTDGDPSSIASSIKKLGVRFITIGCGSQVNRSLMVKMASSKSDYHSAKNASGILQAFQAVAKSLQQREMPRSSTKKQSSSNSSAIQIQSYGSLPHSSGAGTTSAPSVLAENEGYDFIEEFSCHHCSSTDRIACIFCGKNSCGGGTISGIIKCPFCNEDSEVETTHKGVRAGTRNLGGKGKGKN